MGFHIDDIIFTKTPATIAIVLGVCDYFCNIQGALDRKWNGEVWALAFRYNQLSWLLPKSASKKTCTFFLLLLDDKN